MKKDSDVSRFWCRACGSTTAILIGNLKKVRCMGCLAVYEKGDEWVKVEWQGGGNWERKVCE